MRSNVDETRSRIEQLDDTKHVELDGDQSGAIVRAIVEDSVEDFEDQLESVGVDVDITSICPTPFGLEVEVR